MYLNLNKNWGGGIKTAIKREQKTDVRKLEKSKEHFTQRRAQWRKVYIKKTECTELYMHTHKKRPQIPDMHKDTINERELDILGNEVKWVVENTANNKATGLIKFHLARQCC